MSYTGKIVSLLIFILMFPISSCVDPITLQLNENDAEPMLVVAGQLTNEEGPFRVRLTNSVPVNVMYSPEPLTDADVMINDDQGNSFQLYDIGYGWYETEDKTLKGIPGNTYTLNIITEYGTQFKSSPVLMQEVPEIDSLYFEEVKKIRFEDGKTYKDNWLNILLDTRDTENKIKYWHFEFEETWEVKMLTEHVLVEHSAPGEPYYATWEDVDVDDEKITCWVTMPSNSILIATTVNNPVNEIKRLPIQSLGPEDDKLHIRYSILVKQSSVSLELYDFWKQLMDANENVGSIYDKIPAQAYGNISCTNGTAKALGYFSASSVKKRRLFIGKTEHDVETVSAYKGCLYYDFAQLPWIPKSFFGTIKDKGTEVFCASEFCADCRDYGTNSRPDFWE
jgi:hypothetical protein